MKRLDVTGQRYGRLVALEFVTLDSKRKSVWRFQCDCGSIVEKPLSYVRNGGTRSCGCLLKDVMHHKAKPYGEASAYALYVKYKASAMKRQVAFNINFEQFKLLTSGPCYYCGTLPLRMTGSETYNGPYLFNGIDRVNNIQGYIENNCVACCKTCNYAKNDMSVAEFIAWIHRLVKHQKKRLANISTNGV